MLGFKQVTIGDGGPLGCTRCRAPEPASFYPAEQVARHLVSTDSVTFSGPDALLHPELPALIAAAVYGGASRIRIDTDAGGLAVGGNAEGALQAGVRHVQVVVLGDEAAHDRLCGRTGAMAATRAGLAAFHEVAAVAGHPVVVWARVPLCRHSTHHLVGAVTAAAGLGVDIVTIDATSTDIDIFRDAAWLTSACETATVNGVWCVLEGVPFCLVPGFELHVAAVLDRPVQLAKGAACAACPLDPWCPGFSASAPAAVADAVAAPPGANGLAERIAFARGEAAGA